MARHELTRPRADTMRKGCTAGVASRRQRQPQHDPRGRAQRGLLAGDLVNVQIVAGYRHGRRARLGGHGLQAHQAGRDRPARLGLPPVIDPRDAGQVTRSAAGLRGKPPGGQEQVQEACGVSEVCLACELQRCAMVSCRGIMIGRVPSPPLPDIRPALRLAGPARPVNGIQGHRTAGAAGTRLPCCAAPSPSSGWTGPTARSSPR